MALWSEADILAWQRERLKPGRLAHVLAVQETCRELAARYGMDARQASLAGLIHDCAKSLSPDQLRALLVARKRFFPEDAGQAPVWHAPAGAILARETFGVEDPEVLDAVACHTLGRLDMSQLDKVLYCADMIAPGRDFPGVEALRRRRLDGLDGLLLSCMGHTLAYLAGQGCRIHPVSFRVYNAYAT